MRQLLYLVSFVLMIDFLSMSCANPKSPTGGPKDTIPPTLHSSIPEDQSLNYTSREITLNFDEFINADKLKSNLIITPTIDNPYKVLLKKQSVILEFDNDFEDSTTYTLNFYDGITDITERTPAENLIIAFSTGDYIDSLSVFGKITNLFNGKPEDNFTVGLYRITDTLDFEINKPTYFATTNELGQFVINNIKKADYRIFTFNDDNKNLLFNPSSEAYAFINDTIDFENITSDSLYLSSINIDASALDLLSARPNTRYFELRYTKPIIRFDIQQPADTYAQIVGEQKSLRIYQTTPYKEADSTFLVVQVFDSLYNQRTDTVYAKYRKSSKKRENFSVTLNPKSRSSVSANPRFNVTFNKPIRPTDSFNITIPIDTLFEFTVPSLLPHLSDDKLKYGFQIELTKQAYQDTAMALINSIVIDSANLDTAMAIAKNKLLNESFDNFRMTLPDGLFISVENDTSESITQQYNFTKQEALGVVKVIIQTDKPSYFVELMQKDQSIRKQKNCQTCLFTNLKAGDYWVRVLIDENEDGRWSYGNFLKNIEPEPALHFSEPTTLRANWEVELSYTF